MSINIDIPERKAMIPKISVLGVGGAGGNAVNNMIDSKLEGVNFVVANTDAQALINSKSDLKLQLGENTTKGLGAGSSPEVGAKAAEESTEEILSHLGDSHMVFITAGMGGGTGTGAAPIISKICRENNILTVGVITKPFHFEGSYRMKTAELGVLEMQKYVDTLIVIPNQNLFHKATEKTTFAEAFNMVDNVLYSGIKGITDLMTMPGLINLDFADIRTIMGNMGKAMMGTGEASGEKRALDAAEAAISNPLLDNASMKGASGVLINISGGLDMTLFEADEAAQRIRDEVAPEANIIFGSTFDKELESQVRVSVVATGIDNNIIKKPVLAKQVDDGSVNKINENNQQILTSIENKEHQSENIENSFIPPQAVSPNDMVNNNHSEVSDNIVADNVVPLQTNINNEEVNDGNVQHEVKQAVGGDPIAPNFNNVEQNIENVKDSNITSNNKTAKTNKLGGIFNFFKDNNIAQDNEIKAKDNMPQNQNNTSEINHKIPERNSNSEDLTVSDDILNVPSFIRNKNDQE